MSEPTRPVISYDKRRDVAKKMREYDVAEFKESAIVPFLECLGHGYTDWRGILDELADLIDPTCEYVPIGEERFGCSECGYTVELDFDVPVTDETPMPFKHCPECGARVVAPNGE